MDFLSLSFFNLIVQLLKTLTVQHVCTLHCADWTPLCGSGLGGWAGAGGLACVWENRLVGGVRLCLRDTWGLG